MTEQQSERGMEVRPDAGQVQISDIVSENGMALEIPVNLVYREAKPMLSSLWKTKDLSQLYIGDLLNQVEDREYYSQLLDEVQYTERSIIRYKRVAREVAPEDRWPNLSFDHLESVCPLLPEVQNEWLKNASEGHWTTARLRKELRDAGLIKTQKKPDKPKIITCPPCGRPAFEDIPCEGCMHDVAEVRIQALREVLEAIRDNDINDVGQALRFTVDVAIKALEGI